MPPAGTPVNSKLCNVALVDDGPWCITHRRAVDANCVTQDERALRAAPHKHEFARVGESEDGRCHCGARIDGETGRVAESTSSLREEIAQAIRQTQADLCNADGPRTAEALADASVLVFIKMLAARSLKAKMKERYNAALELEMLADELKSENEHA